MKAVLPDTNAFSALFKGDERVVKALSAAETVRVSTVVMGELYFGFKNGSRYRKNREVLDRFLQKPTVKIVNVSPDTADIFSEIYLNLKKKGNPVPMNDLWIAAQAVENAAVVLTFDRHFLRIPGVRVWDELE